eukprot:CAMPEP_0117453328 /NCGR_PEP_ID=MMETSP0759-20121206/10156_1 /TAXON_ID=63605 /ORGANISM="Percolomonas cosmopolitus, Strain WS" /LENGTH=460 /DNA_ID=CAMNT_0005246335 /DNA_START=1594 /DNA_END=2977 /DNA_ORIENTATION=+
MTSSAGGNVVRRDAVGGQLYYETSARKYKSEIHEIIYPLDTLDQLEPSHYIYGLSGEIAIGFIADDVDTIFGDTLPNVVTKIDGEPDRLQYDKMVVPIISYCKQQEAKYQAARLDENDEEINDLNVQLQTQQNTIDAQQTIIDQMLVDITQLKNDMSQLRSVLRIFLFSHYTSMPQGISIRITRQVDGKEFTNFSDIYAGCDHENKVIGSETDWTQNYTRKYNHPEDIKQTLKKIEFDHYEKFVFHVMSVIKTHSFDYVEVEDRGTKNMQSVACEFKIHVKEEVVANRSYNSVEKLLRNYFDPNEKLDPSMTGDPRKLLDLELSGGPGDESKISDAPDTEERYYRSCAGTDERVIIDIRGEEKENQPVEEIDLEVQQNRGGSRSMICCSPIFVSNRRGQDQGESKFGEILKFVKSFMEKHGALILKIILGVLVVLAGGGGAAGVASFVKSYFNFRRLFFI